MTNTIEHINIETKISQLRVRYPHHDCEYEKLKRRIEMAILYRHSGALAFIGDTGAGKSTLMDCVMAEYPRRETGEGTIIPVIYYRLSGKPKFTDILRGLISAYGVPVNKRATENQLLTQFKTLAMECQTAVVVLDEANHFVEEGRRVSLNTAADDMKGLIDFGLLVVFTGTPNLLAMFSQSSQLRRRFSTRIHLRPLDRSQASIKLIADTTKLLLAGSQSALTVDHLTDAHWVLMHFATNGNIAYLNTLVAAAAAEAQRNGHKKITLGDFEAAFTNSIFHDGDEDTNPFSKKFKPRALNLAGEPFADMEVAA